MAKRVKRRGAAKQKAPAGPEQSRPPQAPEGVPRHIEIPYNRPADFRFYACDGALVRAQRGAIVLGFYVDDYRVTIQSADLIETQGAVGTFKTSQMTESFGRLEQLAVRLAPADAIALASVIQQKVAEMQALSEPEKTAEAGGNTGLDR